MSQRDEIKSLINVGQRRRATRWIDYAGVVASRTKECRNADSDTGDAVAASNIERMDDILPVTISLCP